MLNCVKPGEAEGEMHSPLKAFQKPQFHPNIKFMVPLKLYCSMCIIYFNSIKVIVW